MFYKQKIVFTLLCSAMFTMLATCGNDSNSNFSTSPIAEDFSSIKDPAERWRAYGLRSYVFEQLRNCFCVHGGIPFKIYIQNEQIVQITNKATGEALDSNDFHLFKTVPQLFEFLESIDADSVAVFNVQFHPRFGFPNFIYVDFSERIADEEMGFVSANLERLID